MANRIEQHVAYRRQDALELNAMAGEGQLTEAITQEIARAIRKLGGDPTGVNLSDSWQVNRVLEFLGADIYLLTTVGSWGDTITDEQVLDDLRTWNDGGSLAPDTSFVK
jgi:hypothetical protein